VREAIRRGGRDHDRLGPERAGRLGKRFEWRVLAEIRDAPASTPQGKAERDQPEVVLLAWSAGQQSTRPGAAIPTSREAEQPASEELAGEMLLAHRRFAPRPALTELVQVRQHKVREHCLGRELRQDAVECGLRGALVEVVQCLAKLLGPALQDWFVLSAAVAVRLRQGESGCLGGGHSMLQVRAHEGHSPLIRWGVEAKSPIGAARAE